MPSPFQFLPQDSTTPAMDSVPVDVSGGDVTPTDAFRAIRVTGGGNVVVKTLRGDNRTLSFYDGETRPIYVLKVYQTGTTATGIEGLV